MAFHTVFVTGATGYLGRGLAPALVARGHSVRALARPGSAARVPSGAEIVLGDALDGASFAAAIAPADTLVHLVGTPHPNPRKAAEFERVDLGSIRASAGVARAAGVRHLVYVSVAQPAPVMRAYVAARARGETAVAESGVPATVLRPWYVLGPGHRWAYLLWPVYALAERLPGSRASARRLGLVRYPEMIAALVAAVESPPSAGVRIVEVPEIRRARRGVS
ncbi:MAG: NAD(P)H-binding protein [Thermoanaerobaculia bacterium]